MTTLNDLFKVANEFTGNDALTDFEALSTAIEIKKLHALEELLEKLDRIETVIERSANQ